jgi:hypothetical protein
VTQGPPGIFLTVHGHELIKKFYFYFYPAHFSLVVSYLNISTSGLSWQGLFFVICQRNEASETERRHVFFKVVFNITQVQGKILPAAKD